MPMSDQKLPNQPLNGKELRALIVKAVDEMCEKDCMFLPTLAYRRCAFTVTLAVHVGDQVNPKVVARTYAKHDGALEGDVPLADAPADAEFMAVERKKKIINPNLERIHNDMPIRSQRRTQPEPGSPFGGVENVETRYAPGDYEQPEPPEDKDVTERERANLGIMPGPAARQRAYDAMFKDDEQEPANE